MAATIVPRVIATGLLGPRGLAFAPDGSLYVAEAGLGGDRLTVGDCRQIPGPVGPYSGGMTGRISRVGPDGSRSTVADGLPSSRSRPEVGESVSGVADVALVDGDLYALISGAGCSHGLADTTNGIYRVAGGRAGLVADLGAYRSSTTVADPDPGDDEYDGTWYSMAVADGALWTVEPNHGDFVRVGLDGTIARVADVSASQGHIVPTAVAYRPDLDAFFIGNLGRLPAERGSARILRVDRDGRVGVWASGLTTVLGLTWDGRDGFYAVEASVVEEPGRLRPSAGRVVRVAGGDRIDVIASGLMLPAAIAAHPESGALYVSVGGFGPSGSGEIVRIDV